MGDFSSQIFSLPPPFNMVVLIVMFVMGANVISSIAKEMRKYLAHRETAELVRDLAGHGMTAAEIERILKTQPVAAAAAKKGCHGQVPL